MLAAVPLYSALVARVPRARAIPLVYRAFLACLLAFLALVALGVAPALTARAFYVWVSVYGLFVVSIFWSYLADLFTSEQGKRLFGFVAAGGSAGAIGGPLLATLLVGRVGVPGLLAAEQAGGTRGRRHGDGRGGGVGGVEPGVVDAQRRGGEEAGELDGLGRHGSLRGRRRPALHR